MDSDAALSWPISKLVQEATRVAIEGLGFSTFEALYGTLDTNLRAGAPHPWVQIRTAAFIFIEATRKDSPGNNTRVSGISLIWLARNYPACLAWTAHELIERMLPAYYEHRGQPDQKKPLRGYLVCQPNEPGFQITISCVLSHPDEQTQLILHGRDDSLPHMVDEREQVDRYVVHVRPGDRIQFTIHQGCSGQWQETWLTVTTRGPVEEASRSSLWLVRLSQAEIPPPLTNIN